MDFGDDFGEECGEGEEVRLGDEREGGVDEIVEEILSPLRKVSMWLKTWTGRLT